MLEYRHRLEPDWRFGFAAEKISARVWNWYVHEKWEIDDCAILEPCLKFFGEKKKVEG